MASAGGRRFKRWQPSETETLHGVSRDFNGLPIGRKLPLGLARDSVQELSLAKLSIRGVPRIGVSHPPIAVGSQVWLGLVLPRKPANL